MSDEKVTHSGGGFIVPEIAYIDKPINNIFAKFIRTTGEAFIRFGCYIKSLGYYQVEIHPHDDLQRIIKEIGK